MQAVLLSACCSSGKCQGTSAVGILCYLGDSHDMPRSQQVQTPAQKWAIPRTLCSTLCHTACGSIGLSTCPTVCPSLSTFLHWSPRLGYHRQNGDKTSRAGRRQGKPCSGETHPARALETEASRSREVKCSCLSARPQEAMVARSRSGSASSA